MNLLVNIFLFLFCLCSNSANGWRPVSVFVFAFVSFRFVSFRSVSFPCFFLASFLSVGRARLAVAVAVAAHCRFIRQQAISQSAVVYSIAVCLPP